MISPYHELANTKGEATIQEMSRRSRRRKGRGERRWAGKVAVGLLAAGVVFLGVAYIAIRSYLHSDGFRKFLSSEASEMARVSGEFGKFHWDGLAVDADSFAASGDGPITAVKADGLHTEIGLGGLSRGVWEVKSSNIRRLEIFVDATKPAKSSTGDRAKKSKTNKTKRSSWFPSQAELQGIDVGHVDVRTSLDGGLATATGMSIHAEKAGAQNAFRGEITGGVVRLPFGIVPELRLDRALLRYQDKRVFLTKAKVAAWQNGSIEGSGEWDMETRQFSVEGNATGVRCDDLLGADWSQHLTGDVSSDFIFENSSGTPAASGKLVIRNGTLTALPVLDLLAAYADTRRFRVLTLNDARTDWQWKKDEIVLTNLVLASEGLARMEGGIVIRRKSLDGKFLLGLAPGTLATIPGAETDVFLPGEHGLLWTTLRITGTLDDPQEDLTERLIAAAGLRMFELVPETGEKVIRFTRSVIGESPNKVIEEGVKIIEDGSKVVREVSGILDGILGKEEPEPEAK